MKNGEEKLLQEKKEKKVPRFVLIQELMSIVLNLESTKSHNKMNEREIKNHLQMALDFVVGEPIHLHQLPDLLRRRNCKFPTQMSIDHSNEI